jgi:thioesterase domain-containing protein
VPPRTTTERAVAEVWSDILGIENVGVSEDFFDLGGHSLMIVRMIYQINATRKVRLGVPDLFRNPTVEQLATVIESQQSEGQREPSVVQFQEGGNEVPVYFIYAGPDEFHLARLMGASHPVFGIEVPWPLKWRQAVENNQPSSFPDMDQFVAPFVKALSAHVGSASCVLAGHCFAGLIAFETARQFQLQGGKVETVIIVDKWARYPAPLQAAWANLRKCWIEKPADPQLGFAKSIVNRFRRAALIVWWLLKATVSEVLASRAPLGQLTTNFDEDGVPLPWGLLARLYSRLEKNYRFKTLDCRGIIFRTEFMDLKRAVRVLDDNLGWDRFFNRGLEAFQVSGDHLSIIREHNKILASMINKALQPRSNL